MTYNPAKYHRRSIRLKGYDYSSAGAYFVTMCVQGRECILGDVIDGAVILSAMGQIVQNVWDTLPGRFPGIETGAFVIMPNHIHGIIIIITAGAVGRFMNRPYPPMNRRHPNNVEK